MTRRRLRRAGSRWRVLVHEMRPGGMDYPSHHITAQRPAAREREHYEVHHLPGTELDEVVLGRWFHLEQMGAGVWWMDVAGIHITVSADRDGRPRRVMLEQDDVLDGVVYQVPWPEGGGSL